MAMNRRDFLKTSSALVAAKLFAAGDSSRYRIGYTSNTVGGWEGDPFLGFREAHELGYRWVEQFINKFPEYYPDKPQELKKRVEEIGVEFVTISNGGKPTNTEFENPAVRATVVEDHLRLARFNKKLGCDHLKINLGRRKKGGTPDEDLKNIAETLQQIGRGITAEGMRFAPHAHMGSQMQNQHEVEFILSNTDPKHVGFTLDTGHITMGGMDPIALAQKLGPRVVEYHIKDTKPEYRGGAKGDVGEMKGMTDPWFLPMGSGGVDFPALKAFLDKTNWRGFLTVELDTSPFRPPKESARMTRDYIVNTLKIAL
jgi:inosose dehydratase